MYIPPSARNIQELVMEICSDLFHTGRMVTGEQLYSAIDTTEILYEKNLTYRRTINKNRKGLPADIKTVKERANESAFFWKRKCSHVSSVVPKLGKNVLLISTGHEDPDICREPYTKNKAILVYFYNSQRLHNVNEVVNEMLKDCSFHLENYSYYFHFRSICNKRSDSSLMQLRDTQ